MVLEGLKNKYIKFNNKNTLIVLTIQQKQDSWRKHLPLDGFQYSIKVSDLQLTTLEICATV